MISLKELALKLRSIFGKDLATGFEAFEFDTAGGDTFDARGSDKGTTQDFVNGWWKHARTFEIHKGRIGAGIVPDSTVVHTTDMAPGTMAALLKRWRDAIGEGAGAHFLIGKTPAGNDAAIPTGGVVQLASIMRNGNHAGGSIVVNGVRKASHGWYKGPSGKLYHPNNRAVGIELDNAGRLARAGSGGRGDAWVHKDSGKIFAPANVFVDDHGRGYERVTDYQFTALETLLDALDAVMPQPSPGTTIVPNGGYKENGVPEASLPWVREVGHWTLDPYRKTDPGPQVDAFLEARARRS